jgi:murein DD-endopeptidase MepM/ murein hydrolase activator NlpD
VWLEIRPQRYVGYFHLSDCKVTAGDLVFAGDALGTVHDNPVDNDAEHLHFEEYLGDLAKYPRGTVDPQSALEAAKH